MSKKENAVREPEHGLTPWDSSVPVDYGKYAEDRTVVKLDKLPIMHVVQNNSLEADEKLAEPGEVVIRISGKGDPSNPNIGVKFQGVVVARGVQYLWWGDRDAEGATGMPLARCIKGDPMPQGYDAKDTLWPDNGGNERSDGKPGPVADETHTFMVCPYKDGEIGAPALLSYARGGKKTGDGVQMLLNLFKGPCYAAVLEFWTEKMKNAEGKPYYVLKAKGVAALPVTSPLLARLKVYYDSYQPHLTAK